MTNVDISPEVLILLRKLGSRIIGYFRRLREKQIFNEKSRKITQINLIYQGTNHALFHSIFIFSDVSRCR